MLIMALSTKEIILHNKALIKLYRDLSEQERAVKKTLATKISISKTARDVCNAASIRIKCYDDFIQHLQGCNYLLTDELTPQKQGKE